MIWNVFTIYCCVKSCFEIVLFNSKMCVCVCLHLSTHSINIEKIVRIFERQSLLCGEWFSVCLCAHQYSVYFL